MDKFTKNELKKLIEKQSGPCRVRIVQKFPAK